MRAYRKQQKLCGRKLLWFSQIFDKPQNFFLLIDRHRAVDIITEAKSRRFSQHHHKSYQTAKLFSRLTFVVYGKTPFANSLINIDYLNIHTTTRHLRI